jgi:hypothetical protein
MKTSQTFQMWSDAARISRTNAEEIVQKPHREEVIEYAGLVILLFLKSLPQTSPPSFALVATVQQPGLDPSLQLAFRVREDFADAATVSLTDLIRKFADRFGCPMVFHRTEKKLFLAESVPVVQQVAPTIGICSRRQASTALFMISDEPGPGLRAYCGLCLTVDVEKYSAYLAEKPPKKG